MRLLHQYHAVHPNLHSFPTRRSSDLDAPWVVGAPVPLADHVVLPRALQKKVDTHLMFSDGGLSLEQVAQRIDRKSTRLNSSHVAISYAVFCLKKKKTND